MVLPSGEKRGCESLPGWVVSCRASPPAEAATQRSPFHSKAISPPSGDKAGYFTSRSGSAAISGAVKQSATHREKTREFTIGLLKKPMRNEEARMTKEARNPNDE